MEKPHNFKFFEFSSLVKQISIKFQKLLTTANHILNIHLGRFNLLVFKYYYYIK